MVKMNSGLRAIVATASGSQLVVVTMEMVHTRLGLGPELLGKPAGNRGKLTYSIL